MSQNSSIVSTIYKARRTILELLDRQGYNIDEYRDFSVSEVNAMVQNAQLDMLMEKNKDSGNNKKIYVLFYLNKTIRDKNVYEIIEDLFNLEEVLTKNDSLMLITKDEMSEPITNLLKHIWEQDGIQINIINMKRLQFNILDHGLVPPHRVLNEDELQKVKKRYNIMDNKQFPEISRFDPVAVVIGIRPGEVCEIIRPSKTAIEGIYYRICV